MNKHTKRNSRIKGVTVGAAALLGAAALTGALLLPNVAGADPIEGAEAIGDVVGTPSPAHDDGADERLEWVTDAVLKLDEHKANDEQLGGKVDGAGLRLVVDQEDAVTNADGKVRLCLNTQPLGNDYPEPADVDPVDGLGACPADGLAAPYDPRVTSVMVDLAGNLDNPGNSPTETQTRFNVADGAVLVFLKNGEPVRNANVRFTYVAVG